MKKSLNKKITIIFLSVLLALLAVMLIVVQVVASTYVQSYTNDDVLNRHRSVSAELVDMLNEVNYGYTRITKSDKFQRLFTETSSEEKKKLFVEILEEASLSDDYLNVALVAEGRCLMQREDFDLPSMYVGEVIRSSDASLVMGNINSRAEYVEIGRRLQGISFSEDYYFVFYLSGDELISVCEKTRFEFGETMLISSDFSILGKSDGEDVGRSILERSKYDLVDGNVYKTEIDGREYLIVVTAVQDNYGLGWYMVTELDYKEFTRSYTTLMWILVSVAGVCFVLVLIASLTLSHRTIAPINKLSRKISAIDFKKITENPLTIGEDGDELYELEKSYDQMLSRLYQLMDQNKQNMETQRKLEIDALQMQINPHFLYNTLDAIAWMAKIKKQPEIEKLTINLAKFFRLSLHKGDKYIYMLEEAELIEHFLEIEKIRFPNTISYRCDLKDGTENYKVLKLILQPIVENCIKHGFAGKEDVGTIDITAYSRGDDIIIEVSDNGCGFEVEEDFWLKPKKQVSGGYGLYNVNERIRLEYGDGYGLTVKSVVGEGTTVTVKIKKSL